jgi:hypothetical protein
VSPWAKALSFVLVDLATKSRAPLSERTPKEIGRLAGGIFLSALPGRWARRSQEDQEDYGVDYEIELTTADDKASGFIFKVQQKGVEHARRLADGTIAFSLETEKVTYYQRQLRIPIVLVVVEVNSKTSWWVPLHANREIEKALADALAAGQKTMTVHLPAANELAKTHDDLLAAVRRMIDALTLAGLKAMPTADAQAVIDLEPDLDELERGLRLTQSLLRSTRTQRHVERGELDAAFELNKRRSRTSTSLRKHASRPVWNLSAWAARSLCRAVAILATATRY